MSLPYLSNWDAYTREGSDGRWDNLEAAVDAVVESEATLIAIRRLALDLLAKGVSASLEDTFGDLLLDALEAAGGSEMTAGDALDGLAKIDEFAARMTVAQLLSVLANAQVSA